MLGKIINVWSMILITEDDSTMDSFFIFFGKYLLMLLFGYYLI